MNIAFIGIGSNMGDREKNCIDAIRLIEETGAGKILKRSSLYHTPPYGFERQDWFINAALQMETGLGPRELLHSLKSIEARLGREPGFRWGPRLIDLDLLFYNGAVLDSPDLVVPHPGIPERRFVLEPLAEIEAELMHPILKKSISEMLNSLGFSGEREELAA